MAYRIIFITILLFCTINTAYSQQYAIRTYTKRKGFTYIEGKYEVNNGKVLHTYSINGGNAQSQSFECNPNINGECIFAVFVGIDYVNELFSYLNETNINNLNNILSLTNKALDCCESAISAYQKGGCSERTQILRELKEELEYAARISNLNECLNAIYKIKRNYSFINTNSVCGYVY